MKNGNLVKFKERLAEDLKIIVYCIIIGGFLLSVLWFSFFTPKVEAQIDSSLFAIRNDVVALENRVGINEDNLIELKTLIKIMQKQQEKDSEKLDRILERISR